MFRFRLIQAALFPFALAASFTSHSLAALPRDSIPNVRSEVMDCDVTADQLSANCAYRTPRYSPLTSYDRAVLENVNAHPIRLAGATPGARVEVIVRRDPGKNPDASGAAQPLDWAPTPPAKAAALIVDPVWRLFPPMDLIKEFYPERAVRMGIIGDATATCTVGPKGDLVGCWLTSEAPGDQGFGVALLKITTCVQIDPLTQGGQSAAGRMIKVGAHFTLSRGGSFAVQLVLLTA